MRLRTTAAGSRTLAVSVVALCLTGGSVGADGAQTAATAVTTATPIKHLIVVLGENRSFDHVFATYVPTAGHRSAIFCRKA